MVFLAIGRISSRGLGLVHQRCPPMGRLDVTVLAPTPAVILMVGCSTVIWCVGGGERARVY
jgi:hypothetical protein